MLEDRLKEMIVNKYGSVRQFALKIDIPYTTVDSILKRGIDNSNVGNVIKMCKALDISIDNLLDNKEITNLNFNQIEFENEEIMKDHLKLESKKDLLEQYQFLFDKDDRLTEEQKKFFMDFLTEKHKEFDEKINK